MLVETNRLTKTFRSFTALNACDLTVPEGIVFGLLGPNGAGKTTLLRLLLGFMFPSSGSASIGGFDCQSQSVDVHRILTYLPADAQLFGSMKGRSVLRFFADVRHDCDYETALGLAERLELDLTRRVAFMSTGMRQKLALCACLSTSARLTILDEPTANLDPTVRGEVIRMVDEIRSQGRTVIFSSHVLSEIEEVCDRVVIMRQGKIVRDLDMAELKSRHRVRCRFPEPIELPEELKSDVTLAGEDTKPGHYRLDINGDLVPVMQWMLEQAVTDLRVDPIGLRSVYDECHFPELKVGEAATSNPKQVEQNTETTTPMTGIPSG